MFASLLVANRGEIARRIFRTAARMGLRTVAVYSDADAAAPHVQEADTAVRIGPAAARESYLRAEAVLDAARETGAEAIHPGYGFLSENAEFAQAVIDAGLIWVGPRPDSIRAMGLKDAAKSLMAGAGVPVTPGWLGEDQSAANLAAQAEAIGWPVLIKAVAGGGGKGMRRVNEAGEFADALASAQREAGAAFGDTKVLLERYLGRPRHIEVQVFGDAQGNVVHLFERDCSLQRRHQKVIEEAPAPGMDAATREAVCAAAVRAAQAVNYVGAGTVEFIADASEGLRPDRVFFMEMNTRLQVEHPVTEAVTGQDLVEWQLRVAAGEPLPLEQKEIVLAGHAIEARLYAEDPAKGFLPSVGRLQHFRLPETVRVDSAVEEGGEVTPFYDPMIAKLIAFAETRDEAAAELAEACGEVEVWPVRTNAGFLVRCLEHPDFLDGEVDTAFIPSRLEALTASGVSEAAILAGVGQRLEAFADADTGRDVWNSAPSGLFGFRLNGSGERATALDLTINGERHRLTAAVNGAGVDWGWDIQLDGEPLRGSDGALPATYGDDTLIRAFDGGEVVEFDFDPSHAGGAATEGDGAVLSPMPGRVVAVPAQAGQAVTRGQPLVVLEAMKMEHALTAPFDGVVAELPFATGDQVSEGVVLARVKASA